MESGHFNYFRVKNFKRFRDLEVKDIGQFNLVLGDNNVGKTSLLEALMLKMNFKLFERRLTQVLKIRDMYDGLREDVFQIFQNVNATDRTISFEFKFAQILQNIEYSFNFKEHKVEVSASFLQDVKEYQLETIHSDIDIPYIPFSLSYGKDMFDDFSEHLLRNEKKREEVIHSMQTIQPTLKNIEIDTFQNKNNPILRCSFYNSESVALGLLGDGTVKFFRILLEIIKNEFGILLIDEIDTGIHHSRMVKFWKGVIQHSSKTHIQLFATTHNQECIQAFQEALEELGKDFEEKSRIISLVEHEQTKEVSSVTYSFEEFQHSLMAGNEIR